MKIVLCVGGGLELVHARRFLEVCFAAVLSISCEENAAVRTVEVQEWWITRLKVAF